MADLGVQSSTPSGMDAVRARHLYFSQMARLAQIEMQREDMRVTLERLDAEAVDLDSKTSLYRKSNPRAG